MVSCVWVAVASCGGRLAGDEPSDDASVLGDATPAEIGGDVSSGCDPSDLCGGRCVDRMSDPKNCGACGFACGLERVCASGVCNCGAARPLECTGGCVDPRTDPNHCGSCFVRCPTGATCAGGSCVSPAPLPGDRALTLLFAAPDLPPRFVCFGAFPSTAVPAAVDAPAAAMPSAGAIGVPAPTDPTDPTKTTGLPYGAIVPVPVSETMIAALKVFQVVVYLLDENPASSGSTCAAQWKNVKGDVRRWRAFPPNTVAKGDHALLSMIGCLGPPELTGTCGMTGNNFEFRLDKLTQTKPTDGGNIGVQFLHLSQWPGGGGAPSWQNVDIYLAPMPKPTDGDAGVPPTTFIKIAEKVMYRDITPLRGVPLPPDANADHSFLIVAPRVYDGTSRPCTTPDGRPAASCPNYTLPLRPFIGATAPYPKVGGGFFANTNQVIAIVGSAVVPWIGTEPGMPSLRIPFIRAARW